MLNAAYYGFSRTARLSRWWRWMLPLVGLAGAGEPVSAQLVPDGTLGAEGSTVREALVRGAMADLIEGGAMRGSGLFHSFLEFGVEEGGRVYFANPSGIETIFSRVTGLNQSQINGVLGVDGAADLFLLNPNGILFGENARLDISGSFYASTAEKWVFEDGSEFSAVDPQAAPLLTIEPMPATVSEGAWVGHIRNDGDLAVGAGESLTLSGTTVLNRGGLAAPGGSVSLLGEQITLANGTRINVSAETGGGSVRIGNDPGSVQGGTERILMVESGLIEANGLRFGPGGEVILEADGLLLSGQIEATGIGATGGQVQILGDRIGLFGARLEVSGELGGGVVEVGGAYQGGDLRRAQEVGVSSATSVLANAWTQGDGGEVVFWSDGTMEFGGSIQARGGVLGGDGGLVEVSGLEGGTFAGIVDAGAPLGTAGSLLLDPKNITIAADNVSPSGYSLAQTFLNPSPASGDSFGRSVAIDGTNLLIGAYGDDTGATDAGSAYLFNTSGTLLHTLNNPSPADFDSFGFSVAIDGTNLLIGAWQDDTGAANAGSAYLFNTSGTLLHTLNNPSPADFDSFGSSVAIDGTNLLIGADGDDTGATDAGAAYLFSVTPEYSLAQTFLNPAPASGDFFGGAVALDDSNILIGTRLDDTGATNAGAAYLFNTSGTLLQTLNNPAPAINDLFGHAVAIEGNHILIGAYLDDAGFVDSGSAYLFDTSGTLLQTFNDPTPADEDRFGHGIAIEGNNILIGALGNNTGADDAGSAYLFNTSGTLLQTFNNPSPVLDDFFGSAVAIDSSNILIGAYLKDTGAMQAGSAYLFDTSGNLLRTFNNPSPALDDFFGWSVALEGSNVLIGAYQDDTGATDAGSAYLFDTSGTLLYTFNNPSPEVEDFFGYAITIDNSNILIGAHSESTGAVNAGSAYLFGTNGLLLQTFSNPTPADGDNFGYSVAIDDHNLLISSYRDDTGATDAGATYLFNPYADYPTLFADSPDESFTFAPDFIVSTTNTGTSITLQANTDITVNSPILTSNPTGNGGNITFQAGRSIFLNANIFTDNGNLTLIANDPNALAIYRDPGSGSIMIDNGATLNLGTGNFTATIGSGNNSNGLLLNSGNIIALGSTTLDVGSTNNIILNQSGNDFGIVAITSANNVTLTDATNLDLGPSTLNGNLTLTAATVRQNGGPLSVAGTTTLTTTQPATGSVSLHNSLTTQLGLSVIGGNLTLTSPTPTTQVPGETVEVAGTSTLPSGSDVLTDGGLASFVRDGTNVTIALQGAITLDEDPIPGNLTVISSDGSKKIFNQVFLGTAITLTNPSNTLSGPIRITTTADFTTSPGNNPARITQVRPLSVGGTANFTATNGEILLDNPNNQFGSLILNGNQVTLREQGDSFLQTATISGNLNLSSSGNLTQTPTSNLNIGGTASLTATGDLNLNLSSNRFGSLNLTAANTTVHEADSTNLSGLNTNTLLLSSDGPITSAANANLTVLGNASLTSPGDINLGNQTGDFLSFGSLTFNGTTNGSTLNIAQDTPLLLDGLNIANGNLTLQGSTLTQTSSSSLSVSGNATLISTQAAAGNVTLTNQPNTRLGTSLIGGNLDLRVGSVTTVEGEIIQIAGSVTLPPDSAYSLGAFGSNIIPVVQVGTDRIYVTKVGQIDFTDPTLLNRIAALDTATLLNSNSSAPTLSLTGNLTVESLATGVIFDGVYDTATGINLTGANSIGGILRLTTAAPILTNAAGVPGIIQGNTALQVSDKATFIAPGKNIILDNPNNQFGFVSLDGLNVTLREADSLDLLDVTTTGNLTLVSGGGITQTGISDSSRDNIVFEVGGNSSLSATGDITLSHTQNNFGQTLRFSGENVTLQSQGNLISTDSLARQALNLGSEQAIILNNVRSTSLSATALQDIILNAPTLTLRDVDLTTTQGSLRITAAGVVLDQNNQWLVKTDETSGLTGQLDLAVSGDLILDNSRLFTSLEPGQVGQGGDINIRAANLSLQNSALIDTSTFGQGNAGRINLNVLGDLSLDRSSIVSTTAGRGQAGPINLSAGGTVSLANRSNISSAVTGGAIGDGANITIQGQTLNMTGGSQLQALTRGQEDSGNINLNLSQEINVSGLDTAGFLSGVYSSTEGLGSGAGGTIQAQTGVFRLSEGAVFSAQTFNNSPGGNINITAGSVILSNGGQLLTNTYGSGDAGDINLTVAGTVTLTGSDSNFDSRPDPTTSASSIVLGSVVRPVGSPTQINRTQLSAGDLDPYFFFAPVTAPADSVEFSTQIPYTSVQTSDPNLTTGDLYTLDVTAGTRAIFDVDQGFALESYSGPLENTSLNLTDDDYLVQPDENGINSLYLPLSGFVGDNPVAINGVTLTEDNVGQSTVLEEIVPIEIDPANNIGVVDDGIAPIVEEQVIKTTYYQVLLPTSTSIDTAIALYDRDPRTGAITPLNQNTDANSALVGAEGSTDSRDPYLRKIFTVPGTIYVQVTPDGDFGQGATPAYTLQVSRETPNVAGSTVSAGAASGLFARTNGPGQAGDINLNSGQLVITEGAQVSATTSDAGNAGNATVIVQDSILMDGEGSGIFAQTTENSSGNGGNIFIDPPLVQIRNGAGVGVDSQGRGTGGNIDLFAGNLSLETGGFISATTRSTDGGNINLTIGDVLRMSGGSYISTEAGTAQAGGNGGNISIKARFILAPERSNADIIANAYAGNGGNVTIVAAGIFGFDIGETDNPRTDTRNNITASSKLGLAGSTNLEVEFNPVVDLPDLGNQPTEVEDYCSLRATRGSRLTDKGQGGIASIPLGQLGERTLGMDLRPTLSPESDWSSTSTQISTAATNPETQLTLNPSLPATTLPTRVSLAPCQSEQ